MEAKTTPTSASVSAAAVGHQHQHHHHHHEDGEGKPHVTWDEETIAEHDLLRGTRQKIDEPNTPYHYYGSDQEEDAAAVGEHGAVSPTRSLSGKESAPAIEVCVRPAILLLLYDLMCVVTVLELHCCQGVNVAMFVLH